MRNKKVLITNLTMNVFAVTTTKPSDMKFHV